jgi:hypothetical protein
VVYQHVRGAVHARVIAVTHTLNDVECGQGHIEWCAYESGTAAMLFLSLAPTRIADIAKPFRRALSPRNPPVIRTGRDASGALPER